MKIELEAEVVQDVIHELRQLRIVNMEISSKLLAVGRIMASAQGHMPEMQDEISQSRSIAVLTRLLEKALKSNEEIEDKSTKRKAIQ